jgi:hypothetical protein
MHTFQQIKKIYEIKKWKSVNGFLLFRQKKKFKCPSAHCQEPSAKGKYKMYDVALWLTHKYLLLEYWIRTIVNNYFEVVVY